MVFLVAGDANVDLFAERLDRAFSKVMAVAR